MKGYIGNQLAEARTMIAGLSDDVIVHCLEYAALECVYKLKTGNRIFIAGNGGSAATAQHMAAELVGRFAFERPGLSVMALTTDTSVLTAVGNDYGYEEVFARQIQAHGRTGDIFIALSTSGKSPNILRALAVAGDLGMRRIVLTARHGVQPASAVCDDLIEVPLLSTQRIQEAHAIIGHILCGLIERGMFSEESPVPRS